ncbi:MAG: caspase family protein [Myxococcales bacterium]|nr:caspase family protein [Myxococcales bacterium]
MRLAISFWITYIAVSVASAAASAAVEAPARRALLVGINRYVAADAKGGESAAPAESRWTDLRGPKNDVEALRAVLVARFGFRSDDIVVLRDAEASRENILGTLRSHLVAPAKTGDLSLFFFAGHGSQLRNPQSRESDRLDETIVPADSNQGEADIRDKELRSHFNDVLDRGAKLVAIFDSCHSGSVARSIWPEPGSRFLPPSERPSQASAAEMTAASPDVVDPRPAPERRGALVLSAAEAGQAAREVIDEEGRPRGAFTYALVGALRAAAPDETAERLFLRTRARMLTLRRGQNPVLAGSAELRRQPLFGAQTRAVDGGVVAAVLRVTSRGTVVLDGGIAAGIHPGSELVRADDAAPVRLEVVSAAGLGQTTARVVSGDSKGIDRGDLFQLDRWTPLASGGLRIALPETLDAPALDASARVLAQVRRDAPRDWIEDPTVAVPSHVVRFSDSGWELSGAHGPPAALGRDLDADALRGALARERRSGRRVAVFASLPATGALAAELRELAERSKGALQVTDVARAHYVLVGRGVGATVAHAWLRPGPAGALAPATGIDDSALPSRSDWLPMGPGGGGGTASSAKLGDTALRLAELRAWLLLDAPPGDGSFPYHLALRDARSGATVVGGAVFEGDEFELVLEREREAAAAVKQRYVYVVAIDGSGQRTLVFPPRSAGNSGNRLPLVAKPAPRVLRLGDARIRIRPPYGTDTLITVSTRHPLVDPAVLEGAPVRTRDANPLSSLFAEVGKTPGGKPLTVSTHWNVERLTIRSFPAP